MTSFVSLLKARSENELWQTRLRRSVRLLLAFGDGTCNQLEVEARLRFVERQLLRHLLLRQPPLQANIVRAQFYIHHAQRVVLSSMMQIEAILREFSAQQALNPTRWAAHRASQQALPKP